MKCQISLFSLLFFSSMAAAQLPTTPSIPIEETKISILTDDPGVISMGKNGPVSNFRLFLRYSAPKPFQLKLAGYPLELAAGDDAAANITFEHIPNTPATIHLQATGDLEPREMVVPDSLISDGAAPVESLPGKNFPMDGAFTLMARFSTKSKNGTLAARAPGSGKWRPNGKSLFLRGGVLTYDIGWVGAVRGGPDLADGKEHIAILTVDETGRAELLADGKVVAEKEKLTSKDDGKHVFKIGSTAKDFGGDFKDGGISRVMFWKRALNGDELAQLGKGGAETVNTPDFHWQSGSQQGAAGKERSLSSFGAEPGFPTGISLENAEGVTFSEAWIQPLEKSDHHKLVAAWDDESFKRGKAIYSQLCVTCHGTPTQEGSIPLSLKFHSGEFKNGNDPYRMWQTLTKGFGLMMPMPQYSTRQKYDVIHYIRKEFLAKLNPKQLSKVDDAYLSALPRGMTLIEEKEAAKRPPQYELMDFGNVLIGTYQIEPGPIDLKVNIAQKGIAIRLDPGPGGISKGKAWAIYDHDTMRLAAFYTGNQLVDWKGIDFDGSHGTHTSIVGDRIIVNPDGAGWANPTTGEWDAPRVVGRDGRKFGPIPRDWARFHDLYLREDKVVFGYFVGETRFLEVPSLIERDGVSILKRQIAHGSTTTLLRHRLGPVSEALHHVVLSSNGARIATENGFAILEIPPSEEGGKIALAEGRLPEADLAAALNPADLDDLQKYTAGGPPKFPGETTTAIRPMPQKDGAFEVDDLTSPDADLNPFQSWMRLSGFDFFPDGKSAAVCTWMGDVWIVDGIDQPKGELKWQRICAGLFQPLGLKIVDRDVIAVSCRDMVAKLYDLNGDREIDRIDCFNDDHQVTEHFHEFAMGLQTDAAGNFYYAKSARHAKTALVPHHGTLLRISADGKKTDILATGFRAANGVCLNPDGTFIVTDQEGHWNPKNRINWVSGDGPDEFFGNIFGYTSVTDQSDSAMKPPLCWITNAFDRSPAELLWVPENAGWGALNGQLLNLSYGYGKIYVVPFESANGVKQGGMCQLPIASFPTGVMRGRFHPEDGQFYGCGMFAWAGTQQQAGGFYRVRKTGRPAYLPLTLRAGKSGMTFALSDPVDPNSVQPENFKVMAWNLKRTANYGSKHYDERELKISAATLAADGKTVTLDLPDLAPTWGMSIEMRLAGSDGKPFERLIHNSVFELGN